MFFVLLIVLNGLMFSINIVTSYFCSKFTQCLHIQSRKLCNLTLFPIIWAGLGSALQDFIISSIGPWWSFSSQFGWEFASSPPRFTKHTMAAVKAVMAETKNLPLSNGQPQQLLLQNTLEGLEQEQFKQLESTAPGWLLRLWYQWGFEVRLPSL